MDLFSKIEIFFQTNSGLKDFFSEISKSSTFKICVNNDCFFVFNKNKLPQISIYNNEIVDLEINFPKEFINKIIESNPATSKELIIKSAEIYENSYNKLPNENFKLKINIGMLKFISRGYLKILTIGGTDLTNILKKQGIHSSISSIKTMLKQFMK